MQLLDLLLLLLASGSFISCCISWVDVIPEVVVAHVHLDLVVVDVHDVGADGVEEVPVVADHDDGALEVQQKVLQPVDGVDVQVVGGLVQQQDVRVAEQRLGQQHLHLRPGRPAFVHHVVVHATAGMPRPCRIRLAPRTRPPSRPARRTPPPARRRGCRPPPSCPPWRRGPPSPCRCRTGAGLPMMTVSMTVIGVVGVLVLLEHRHAGLGQDGRPRRRWAPARRRGCFRKVDFPAPLAPMMP